MTDHSSPPSTRGEAAHQAGAADEDLEQDGPFRSIDSAPKDGSLVVGRLYSGECRLMRWRSRKRVLEEDGPDDQREFPYWAQWHTDKEIDPVEWAPTRLRLQDVLDRV